MNKNVGKLVLIALAMILLSISAYIAVNALSNRRVVVVYTDTTPVKFLLNDRQYNLKNKDQSLAVKPGYYNYRASRVIEGREFTIEGSLDVVDSRRVDLVLNYKLYTNTSLTVSICEAGGRFACGIKPSTLGVVYLEGQQWAVAFTQKSGERSSKAILRINNGQWKVLNIVDAEDRDAEPVTAPVGYYPQSVEEAFQNVPN